MKLDKKKSNYNCLNQGKKIKHSLRTFLFLKEEKEAIRNYLFVLFYGRFGII